MYKSIAVGQSCAAKALLPSFLKATACAAAVVIFMKLEEKQNAKAVSEVEGIWEIQENE